MNENRPFNRRHFFREGILELLRSASKAAEPLIEAAKQFEALDDGAPSGSPAPAPYHPPPDEPLRHWLRPPGALAEETFRQVCSRCGECVRICPVQCIQMDYSGYQGDGAPYIDPDLAACILCEGIPCASACPSGALVSVARNDVRMGLASWNDALCLRTAGQECSICVDRCPMGSAAISIVEGRIVVMTGGCTGCGVCQHECPTTPKSITVLPQAAMIK